MNKGDLFNVGASCKSLKWLKFVLEVEIDALGIKIAEVVKLLKSARA